MRILAPKIICLSLPYFLMLPYLMGCALRPVSEDITLPGNIPHRFSRSGELPPKSFWWEDFKDPMLHVLIDQALASNFNLKASWARLRQAEAIAKRSGAALYPSLEAAGQVLRSKTALTPDRESYLTKFALPLETSWEIDIWQKIRATKSAASLDAQSEQELLMETALILSGQVAEAYYSIIESKSQLRLLNEQQQLSATFLDLVELRFGQGISSAVDVYQQREQLASTESQVPPQEAKLQTEKNRLMVLLGKTPGSDDFITITLPESQDTPLFDGIIGDIPNTGVAADILLNRPDIRRAIARVAASDYRVSAALADRFPSLRISASAGYSTDDLSNVFESFIWQTAGSIVLPLIDGGRRRAELERTKAVLAESLAQFEQAVITALNEIEDALIRDAKQQELIKRLEIQLSHAQNAYRESQSRYAAGLSEYLPVLTALRTQQAVERIFLMAQKEQMTKRIALYLSLGGSFYDRLRTTVIKGN